MGKRGVMIQYFEWYLPNTGTLWKDVVDHAQELRDVGITAVWLPPPYKGQAGKDDVGYGVYDLYDLGEFDQKGTVRTKYGTKDEYVAAVQKLHDAGLHVYIDTVLNHRMGGDETETVKVCQVDQADRNKCVSEPYEIKAWSKYTFAGRGGKYSSFQYNKDHFNAFGADANKPDEKGKIYLQQGHTFSGEVDFEFGNFDYLMGADVNHYHPDVRADLLHWADWVIETTNVEGFRLDAVKHIPASFYKEWFEALRTKHPGRELFGVGEYWSANLDELTAYIESVEGTMTLFDVPLHFHLHEAGEKGRDYDLSKVFDGTLVQKNPLLAVTFVENHDSQPGQSLQSPVKDWFKPLAYALTLLRRDGYPCVFYADYYGNDSKDHPAISHRVLLDVFLKARAEFCFGEQHDYFDHPQCVAWYWSGDDAHPGAMGRRYEHRRRRRKEKSPPAERTLRSKIAPATSTWRSKPTKTAMPSLPAHRGNSASGVRSENDPAVGRRFSRRGQNQKRRRRQQLCWRRLRLSSTGCRPIRFASNSGRRAKTS